MSRAWALLLALIVVGSAASAHAGQITKQTDVHFRGDFALLWAITDGQGIADHAGLTITLGPQFGSAVPCRCLGVAPIVTGTFGAAEGGEFSFRVGAGAELVLPIVEEIELIPSLLAGYFHSMDGDERRGPFLKAGLGFRLLPGVDDFWVQVEPLAVTLLPPPEGGFTRYTTHVAVDIALVRFGGRTP